MPLLSKSHSYWVTVPSGSLEPLASSVAGCPATTRLGVETEATGGWSVVPTGSTVTVTGATAVAPSASVTRTRSVYVPGLESVVEVVGVVPVLLSKVPSPSRSHSYLTIEPPGSGSLAVAVRSNWLPAGTGLGDAASVTVGGWVTMRGTVLVPVSPASSVTRSPTWYVPWVA